MLSFLVVGTFWFWLLVVAEIIIVTALVENEAGIWATGMLIFGVIALNAMFKVPIFHLIQLHPLRTAMLVLVYFIVGAIWSIAKWYFYVHKQLARYEQAKAEFLDSKQEKTLTPSLANELSRHVGLYDMPPSARKHKADLVRWSTYWPFSVIGTLLNDVVRKAWTYIYERLQTTYQRISNHVFRGVAADIELAKQYRPDSKND